MPYRGIVTQTVGLPGHNGDEIEAYVAKPEGDGRFPGVVLLHHMPGWDESTLEFCWKLAHNGFAVVAPHLYSRHGPGDAAEMAVRGRAAGLPDDQVVGDAVGAARYLKSQPFSNGKAGVIGFCSSGRQTFLVACRSRDFDAAVDCWGGGVIVDDESKLTPLQPVAPISLAADLSVPLLGIFGNDDDNPSPDEVNRTEEELKRLGKTYEFYRYDGAAHAFFSTDRYRYRPEQAVDAWQKVFAFFRRHLAAAAGPGSPPRFIGPAPSVSLSGRVPLRPA